MTDPSPRFHANTFRLHGSGFDVALDFGYRARAEDEVEQVVRVTTSWEHLRLMLPIMHKALEEFEQKVGPIPRVDEATDRQQLGLQS